MPLCKYKVSDTCKSKNATDAQNICNILQEMVDNCPKHINGSNESIQSAYIAVLNNINNLIHYASTPNRRTNYVVLDTVKFTFNKINIALAIYKGQYVGHLFYEGASSEESGRTYSMFVGISKAKALPYSLNNIYISYPLITFVEQEARRLGYKYTLTFPLSNMRNILFGFGFKMYYDGLDDQMDLFLFKELSDSHDAIGGRNTVALTTKKSLNNCTVAELRERATKRGVSLKVNNCSVACSVKLI